MLIVTTDAIPGFEVERVFGEVFGVITQFVKTGFRLAPSGNEEIPEYTQAGYALRNEALSRMWQQAQRLGANAIVGSRLESRTPVDGIVEICAFGTAVAVRALAQGEEGATDQSIRAAMEEDLR